jgi:sensor histidine kinase YesM
MSSAPPPALTHAPGDGALVLPAARGLVERAVRGITWHGLAVVTGFAALYGSTLGIGAIVGAVTLFLPAYVLGAVTAQFAPSRPVPRALVLALAVAAGVALGYALTGVEQPGTVSWRGGGARHIMAVLPVLLTAWLGLAILLLHERERAANQALHDEVERKLDLERRMSEARLRVLQSQIEPHFLFNTLAHVRRLCRTNTPAGRAMLRHLAHYIGAAQPALRHASIPLAADVNLAVAYLNIQQIRMGDRLRFDVDLAPAAQNADVPPMTLVTLVENAIKHGLSPLAEGGEVRITARMRDDAVVVDVADSGRGFQSTIGAGVGLANIRARLVILHGAAASLELAMNTPQGVVATVVLPCGRVAGFPR